MTEVAYVNVYINDLERSVQFYENVLGLEKEFADTDFGYGSFTAGPVRLGIAVAGDEHADLVGRQTGIGLSTKDLDADYARLKEAGVPFSMPPQKQPWGGYMAMLEDPDGNSFYLDQVEKIHS